MAAAPAEVAASHGVSWPTVQAAVAEHAAVVFGEPGPTAVIGIDETRFGSPKRARNGEGRWRLTDPWETAIPALAGGQGLLGQVTGRTSAAVIEWLSIRSPALRAPVQVVALDPSAPNAAAVRPALPHARIAVDHFHLVKLANDAVTTVRAGSPSRSTAAAAARAIPRGRTGAGCRAPTRNSPSGRSRRCGTASPTPTPPGSRWPTGSPRSCCASCWPARACCRPHQHLRPPVPLYDRCARSTSPRSPPSPRAAGLPRDEDHQCRDRGHQPADQASQARHVRLS